MLSITQEAETGIILNKDTTQPEVMPLFHWHTYNKTQVCLLKENTQKKWWIWPEAQPQQSKEAPEAKQWEKILGFAAKLAEARG